MDYVVGSIAALISGNVTPNRPKLIRRALTPTKHPVSPNVTPKSEFVDDRSIFLSPTQQKKKAIVKKSPKRIFENPDLDVTENCEGSSPKAEKVKKHLKDELEASDMGKSSIVSKKSLSNKLDNAVQSDSPNKKSKINNTTQVSNENTPKKKKRKSKVTDNFKTDKMDINEPTAVIDTKDSKSPKKKERRKSVAFDNSEETQTEELKTAADKPDQTVNVTGNQNKKNKKRNKKNKQAKAATVEDKNGDKENELTTEDNGIEENKNLTKSPKKKKNRKKNKKAKATVIETKSIKAAENNKTPDTKEEKTEEIIEETPIAESDDDNNELDNDEEGGDVEESDDEISNIANPNAITEKDTDSEHDSDDEIESENEEINEEVLKNDDAEESSDDEVDVKTKKGDKKKKVKAQKPDKQESTEESADKEVDTEEVIKRTLFVGNVPFSDKCKKQIKKIFSEYGDIETVRIRTVPVKDARVTPKLAIIKNEIHPDRSTVNVYIKFTHPDSVERALVENNTVLNNHHLRVSRSGATGVEHDPARAVFVGNLPFGIEDETLRAKFQGCGDIESVRIVRDKKTNAGKGFGYVNFASKDGVELALLLSEEDLTVKNRIIRVKRCTRTLSKGPKGPKPGNKPMKHGPKKDFGNNQGPNRNFGNNQGPNRNFGKNQGPGNNQGPNRNFGNNQGPNKNFGKNQGPNRNFGNNQGPSRNFGNNQGPNRNFGNNQGPRNFGNNQNQFGNQGNEESGASRRIMNKRPHQESAEGPPHKKQNVSQPREKKQRKEFVGMTAEKKKKQKFDKGQKKKKAISEIMTKK